MAANAISILEDDDTLARFKKQARAEARKFDIEAIVPMYEEVYLKALKIEKV